MKKLILLILTVFASFYCFAHHLKGGWIYYEYLGAGSSPNTSQYRVTVNQYLNCNSTGGQIDRVVYLGIFDGASNTRIKVLTIPLTTTVFEQKSSFDACVDGAPYVCYRVDKYVTVVDLSNNSGGYTLAVQRCCRIDGIINVKSPSDDYGVTYMTKIPGIVNGIVVRNNNSPLFEQKDTAVVCINSYFTFDFSATDKDGDSLSYEFCNGLTGGDSSRTGAQPYPPAKPPYAAIPYNTGFTAESPLGPDVTIDEHTGIISGISPNALGDYVVAVCAKEFRGDLLIGQTKKEIHITVANCSIVKAVLKESYTNCDKFDYTFSNEGGSSSISSYLWHVYSGIDITSTQVNPVVTFPDTGTYKVKLVVANGRGCTDSAQSTIKVYPGFKPDFSITGTCMKFPYQFSDKSVSTYGEINSWQWDFGDDQNEIHTSNLQNPVHQYTYASDFNVQFIVGDTKGCTATLSKPLEVHDVQTFAGNDTNVVAGQPLQLHATGAVDYLWLPPATGISDVTNPDQTILLNASYDTLTYILKGSIPEGCVSFDTMHVIVFKTMPEIFVPTAFTPNNDRVNDILRPILAGMKSLEIFSVYNRWGQMLFTTSEQGTGWDGKFAGKDQPSGTYVFMVKATDYTGKRVIKKGTFVLIR